MVGDMALVYLVVGGSRTDTVAVWHRGGALSERVRWRLRLVGVASRVRLSLSSWRTSLSSTPRELQLRRRKMCNRGRRQARPPHRRWYALPVSEASSIGALCIAISVKRTRTSGLCARFAGGTSPTRGVWLLMLSAVRRQSPPSFLAAAVARKVRR